MEVKLPPCAKVKSFLPCPTKEVYTDDCKDKSGALIQYNELLLWNLFKPFNNMVKVPEAIIFEIPFHSPHICTSTDYITIRIKETFRLSTLQTSYVLFTASNSQLRISQQVADVSSSKNTNNESEQNNKTEENYVTRKDNKDKNVTLGSNSNSSLDPVYIMSNYGIIGKPEAVILATLALMVMLQTLAIETSIGLISPFMFCNILVFSLTQQQQQQYVHKLIIYYIWDSKKIVGVLPCLFL
eukprot:TRINITY_DN26_c0_g1_i1.p4 TRINITY_DN26_c0_g1~~TRINITY_DN26_c0_g1_i1.p4  ORF type:complete len:241 (-),score=5.87 TRINITY_DN26_c0_g1_i1:2483-3205(-)